MKAEALFQTASTPSKKQGSSLAPQLGDLQRFVSHKKLQSIRLIEKTQSLQPIKIKQPADRQQIRCDDETGPGNGLKSTVAMSIESSPDEQFGSSPEHFEAKYKNAINVRLGNLMLKVEELKVRNQLLEDQVKHERVKLAKSEMKNKLLKTKIKKLTDPFHRHAMISSLETAIKVVSEEILPTKDSVLISDSESDLESPECKMPALHIQKINKCIPDSF